MATDTHNAMGQDEAMRIIRWQEYLMDADQLAKRRGREWVHDLAQVLIKNGFEDAKEFDGIDVSEINTYHRQYVQSSSGSH